MESWPIVTFGQVDSRKSYMTTVKRKIIGEDLFGEIGELKNFAKISSHQMKKYGTPTTFFQ